MGHFTRINQQIENASRKFLADIESWRKLYFHDLKTLVDDYGIDEPDEWLLKLQKWAEKCQIWPTPPAPTHRLKRGPAHWQTRAFIWTTRLKLDFSRLIHERLNLTRQQTELYKDIGLRYSSKLPDLIEEIQNINLQLHKLEINNAPTMSKALQLRTQIDQLLLQLSAQVEETEKPLDLIMSDQTKADQTSKLLKIRVELDDNSCSLSLVRRYLSWAAQEPYIAEVIKYLDRADAIMTHCVNQINKTHQDDDDD